MTVVLTSSIRRRRDTDLPSCVTALARVFETSGYPEIWPADPAGFLSPPDVLGAWVAVEGDAVLGHVLLRDGKDERAEFADARVDLPDELASVSRLFTVPAARGRGLAGRLMSACVEAAGAMGREVILSVVEHEKSAAGMYERMGWRYLTSRPGRWRLADGGLPTLRYYRQPQRT